METDIRHSDEERAILTRVVNEANRTLEQLWQGTGRQYFVSYIELGSRRYDKAADKMVPEPLNFLAADVRDSSLRGNLPPH